MSGFMTQYGVEIDSLFTKGEGKQYLGLYDYTGMDIGTRFIKGRISLKTSIHGANGGDISDVLGGRDYGIFRPAGYPWNVYSSGYDRQKHVDHWKEVLNAKVNGGDSTEWKEVAGILDDSYCRQTHSDWGYSIVVFAMSPFDTEGVEFKCERFGFERWHNSWCDMLIDEIVIAPWLKGFVLHPNSGAGGGFHLQLRFTAQYPKHGKLVYEGVFGHHHDSNMPHYANYGYNENKFGKQWTFHY